MVLNGPKLTISILTVTCVYAAQKVLFCGQIYIFMLVLYNQVRVMYYYSIDIGSNTRKTLYILTVNRSHVLILLIQRWLIGIVC